MNKVLNQEEFEIEMSKCLNSWLGFHKALSGAINGIPSNNHDVKRKFNLAFKLYLHDSFKNKPDKSHITDAEFKDVMKRQVTTLLEFNREVESIIDEELSPLIAQQMKLELQKTFALHMFGVD